MRRVKLTNRGRRVSIYDMEFDDSMNESLEDFGVDA